MRALLLAAAALSSTCSGQQQQTSKAGADGQQEVPLSLSLEDVYKGKTIMANLASEQPCPTCQGKGYVAGPTGAQWPCDKCGGTGKHATTTNARIIIPRGVPDGSSASVPTKAGTVRVKFTSQPHKLFKRVGQFDLALAVTLQEAEAEGGFTRSITLLSGSTLLLTRVGPSASIDFLPVAGLGMPKGPKDTDGFGELGITFTLARSVTDAAVRNAFATRSATLPRMAASGGGAGSLRLQLLGSLESSKTQAAAGLIAAMRIRDEDTASKGWRVMDGTRCFGKDATVYTWEALLSPRAGVSGGLVAAAARGAGGAAPPAPPDSYTLSGATDTNPEFNSYGFGSLNGVYLRNGWLCNGKPMYQKKNAGAAGAAAGAAAGVHVRSGWALFVGSDSKSWVVAPGCNHPTNRMEGVPVAELNAALLGTDCTGSGGGGDSSPNSATCVWAEGNADSSGWEPRPQLKLQPAVPVPKAEPLLLDGETLSVLGEGSEAGAAAAAAAAAADEAGGGGAAGGSLIDSSVSGGLGARLLLLRPVDGAGGLDKAWEIVGQTPAFAYSGEEARQLVVLDTPLEANAGDCLGVAYEHGGVAALHFVPGETHRKDTRVCQGVADLSGVAGEVPQRRLEHRHCTEVSRQYLMQVGYMDAPARRRPPQPPPQPQPQPQPSGKAGGAAADSPQADVGDTNAAACAESSHKMWLADGTAFPRQVMDQDTISLAQVTTGPRTFVLKTCFQLPQSLWKHPAAKVLGVAYSFAAPGVLQTAWQEYCASCVETKPGNRAEVASPPLQIDALPKAGGAGQMWYTKLKVTVQGCARPLQFASDGVQVVP